MTDQVDRAPLGADASDDERRQWLANVMAPRPETGFTDVLRAKMRDERGTGFAIASRILDGGDLAAQDAREGPVTTLDLEKATAGLSHEDTLFILENGRAGQASLRRAQARLAMRKETDAVTEGAGVWTNVGADILVDMMNPAQWALTGALGVATMGGRAAYALNKGATAAGAYRAAVAAPKTFAGRLAEDAAINVAQGALWGSLRDTLGGDVMGVTDYAADIAGAVVFTGALHGAAAGVNHITRKLRALSGDPRGDGIVADLRAEGLEPGYAGKVEPDARPTEAEAQANAALQAKVARQAEAELLSPVDEPGELFDDAYRKAFEGGSSEPASAPLAAPKVEAGTDTPTAPTDRDSGPGDHLRFGFFTKPTDVPPGAVADPTTNLSWSPPEGGATHWETRRGYGKFFARVRAGEKQLPNILGDRPPLGADGKPTLTPGEMAQANTDLVMKALDSTPLPGQRLTVTISPEARTLGGVKEAQLYREVIESLQAKYLPDDALPIQLAVVGEVGGDSRARGIALPGDKGNLIGMQAGLGEVGVRTVVHEFGHVMTFEWGKHLTSDEWGKLLGAYRDFVNTMDPAERGLRRYAAGSSTYASARDGAEALADAARKADLGDEYVASMAEFAAEQFVKFIQKDPLGRGLPAKAVHVIKGMVKRLMALFQDAKHRKLLDAEEAFEDFFQSILDGKMRGRVPRSEPGGAMGPVLPDGEVKPFADIHDYAERRAVGAARTAATDKMRQGLYERAVSFMMANPIKTERLRTINKHVGGALSAGLHMAGSQNAGIQMLAARLAEVTSGAAGRGNTAAVRLKVTQQKILGTSLREYTGAWHAWAKANGVPITRRWGINDHRSRFDEAVRAEMLRRRSDAGEVLEPMDPVRLAADALDKMNQRALDEARAANIIGAANLPETSRGYFTQKLDGRRIADIDRAEPGAQKRLVARLGEHFAQNYGVKPELGQAIAEVYVRRVVDRTYGNGMGPHMDEAGSVVRSLREEMEHLADGIDDPALKQQLAESVKGMSNTRRRLDVPLDDPEVARFFDNNLLGLARGYVHRMAAEVATTRVGLLGLKGVRELRAAALTHGPKPTKAEIDATDQVIAEVFGTPVHGAVTSVAAQNVRSLTASVRLGGAVFAQAGDMMNVAAALGTKAALGWMPALARHIQDIRAINRGGETKGILQGVERWGGQVGMRDYLIEMPLDAPETALTSYSEQPGILTQLIRHVGYASQGINFFRGFVAVQHRHVAEEVLKHVVGLHLDNPNPVIVDGKPTINGLSAAIRDMGFTEELIGRLGPAIRLENGRVKGFDPAMLSHKDAETFVTSLHRGVAQMIQSNFAGENNAWAHNDWVKIMTQFRTFSITAMEKQWARRRAVAVEEGAVAAGYAHIGGHLLAQMAVGALLYSARVQVSTIGMSERDRRKRLDKAFTPAAIATGALNASTLSGYTGEVFSALSAMQSWLPEPAAKVISSGSHGAGRGDRGSSVLDSVPAVGYIEQASKAIQKLPEKDGLYNLARVLPGANSPLVIPFVNVLKD